MRIVYLMAALIGVSAAHAGDVYVSRDATGNIVYTDTPQTIPAKKIGVASTPQDDADADARAQAEMEQYQAQVQAANAADAKQAAAKQASQQTAEQQAQQCAAARERYRKAMEGHRLYEQGPNGERIYLDSDQIDATRQSAKKAMDQLCNAQPSQ